ncbi:pyridoxal-phosphate-dependent aminotransferase family protein [Hwanghaeella sp.]|uniref:pyridoxal-phosphate-dependent aminotransferase family protein n=1 Tax=Hwanghaeella sp. TaxID=2605943 RepID=UPI003CCBB1C7
MSVQRAPVPMAANEPAPVKRGREFLNVPGPTNIPERILTAMHRPAVDFSGPEFIDIAVSCFRDLKWLFRTEGDVFIYAANGHAAWEAAMVNTLSPGDTILVPETGHFSTGWGETAAALGLKVKTVASDWRRAIDPAAVEQALRADTERAIKAVLMVHTDTATGVTSDIQALRASIDTAGHPALFMVDAIASLATTPLEMDEWGVDVVVAASQKGLMCPPGVALVAAGAKAMDAHASATLPRRYWDWTDRTAKEHYRKFCGTAPEHTIFGLREALNMLQEETLEGAFRRHARLAEAVRLCVEKWCEGGALQFNAVNPHERSDAVTTILLPPNVQTDAMRAMCRDHFSVAVGGGLGKLIGKAFRIGHMGDMNEPMILGCLASVEAALKRLEVPIGSGGVQAAIDWLAQPPR